MRTSTERDQERLQVRLRVAEESRDRYWRALARIATWESWQSPSWREIACEALDEHEEATDAR